MRRRLFTIASALSLLLCVATVFLWVASHRVGYVFAYQAGYLELPDTRALQIGIAGGELDIGVIYAGSYGQADGADVWRTSHLLMQIPSTGLQISRPQPFWGALGFDFQIASWGIPLQPPSTGHAFDVMLPMWLLTLLMAAAPAAWLTRRWRRRSVGFVCCTCNYNLTGNISGVCPECGTAIQLKAATGITGSTIASIPPATLA